MMALSTDASGWCVAYVPLHRDRRAVWSQSGVVGAGTLQAHCYNPGWYASRILYLMTAVPRVHVTVARTAIHGVEE